MKGIKLYEFQEKAVDQITALSEPYKNQQVITVKSPTGSGKTIILLGFVDKYLNEIEPNTAFIWLCPGKGDLEMQSMKKMEMFLPSRTAYTMDDALKNGFTAESVTFINWELVTKKGNNAIKDSEKKNLFDRIVEAKREQREFIIIVDEEHSNKTAKAQYIIDKIDAKHIIRVSATAKPNKKYEFIEIDEQDVIDAGLITKAIYVNEGVVAGLDRSDDFAELLTLADAKRKEIQQHYRDIGSKVRPLVLIQFPAGHPETIQGVENKLEEMGYTYDNRMVSIWMSEKKIDLPDNLTENDAEPVFLLMKQAISTGWDCPRAKILVKLREGMSEDFTIQTIGRIRRMPERKHYGDDVLDCCYVYTYDEKYKSGLLSDLDKSYEVEKLFLKNKCKAFTLTKETRDMEFAGIGDREVMKKIRRHLIEKYHLVTRDGEKNTYLSNDEFDQNKKILEGNGYIFSEYVLGRLLQGRFATTDALENADDSHFLETKSLAGKDNKHYMQLLRAFDDMKGIVGLKQHQVRAVFRKLFSTNLRSRYRLLALDGGEFTAFIINNEKQLKNELREVATDLFYDLSLELEPRKVTFSIPEEDLFRYDPTAKDDSEYMSNAFKKYSAGNTTSKIRSTPELLFEQYCEDKAEMIDWVYKNGDGGSQYFSLVYLSGTGNQQLFYPDYIVRKKNGDVWIIETKGGEQAGRSKNIDPMVETKFNALKEYCRDYKLKWGFVRDVDGKLYINNTKYVEDMKDKRWEPLKEKF